MTKRTVVIRKKSCGWQPNIKRKTQTTNIQKKHVAGFISPVFVVLACTVFSGLFYMYSINDTAIKGIAIKQAENQIDEEKKQNESLKIEEAQLKSLYHIEEASKQIEMINAQDVKYIEESPTVAYGSGLKNH